MTHATENFQNSLELKRPLIVFSHLRWDFVTQRPQHLISRLAAHRPVLFVEEAIPFGPGEKGQLDIRPVLPNLSVLQLRTTPEELLEQLATLLPQQEAYFQGLAPDLWFYSAAFHPLAERLPHRWIIYDCMDELSAFKGAPASLVAQEKALLADADVVFTGGKSLYEAKRLLSDNVYCYPSSVDRAHFEQALQPATPVPADIQAIEGPIVGYYGVIDERIDYELLANAAWLLPNVSFVMIGPVVKVDPAQLPQAPNLHYLGGKNYAELPGYLKAFDVAMMPFALNESTRFISPTKTLEYIAAQKPIVSTPIHDVVRDYSAVVEIAADASAFCAAIRRLLHEDEQVRKQRQEQYENILQAVSWDKTAAAMQQNLAELTALPTQLTSAN